ncbi:MAG: phosphatase PAP2 family protein [Actinomycetota bacterium]
MTATFVHPPPSPVLGPAALTSVSPCLHRNPPLTPTAFFSSRRHLLVGAGIVFGFLALAAAVSNAWLLLQWDEPIQRYVEGHRSGTLDVFFLTASRFGSTLVVLSLGVLFSVLTWRRCRAVAIAAIAATFGRPLVEFLMKAFVERDRPDLERMVDGVGYSFPSGHVMAAVALWGLLPLVVGLFTRRRVLWWSSVFVAGVMIVAIAASRLYLGVHWFSDVVGGLLVGSFFLIGIEYVVHRAHAMQPCRHRT